MYVKLQPWGSNRGSHMMTLGKKVIYTTLGVVYDNSGGGGRIYDPQLYMTL